MTEKKRKKKRKKTAWTLLNPFTWLEAALSLLASVFGPLLRWMGMLNPPSTEGFENIQCADVDDAKKLATEQEAAVDAISQEMSPAEVVHAYARADAVGRSSMDLSALDFDQQDWLLRLSDEDLDKLSMSTTAACGWSLEKKRVLPSYPKVAAETEAPEVLTTPSAEELEQMKQDFVSARFRELFHAPGVPNTDPRYVPDTLH